MAAGGGGLILGLGTWDVVNIASGFALAAVGVFVARVGRGEASNRAFGLYAAGFGLGAAADNVVTPALPYGASLAFLLAGGALALVGLAGLARFALVFPRPLDTPGRRAARGTLALFALGAIALVPHEVDSWRGALADPRPLSLDVLEIISASAFDILRLALMCTAVLFAFRLRAAQNDPSDEAQRIALVAAALVMYPMAYAGWANANDLARGELARGSPLLLHLALLVVITWLCLASTRSLHHHAAARNVALVGWAAGLVGMVMDASDGPASPSWLARAAEILLVAYAVVRYQLLGIDVKVRWGISKGSVGAVFVGVFFVASEAAQQFFGATTNNQFVGIIAAGALVFALAPLQRAADRLAAHAVPLAAPLAAAAGDAAALYRRQVELAWTDGTISPNERVMLRGLRKNLGLDAALADDIEHEVETERMRAG